jgi:SAM-dependent methyltransferase
MKDEAVIWHDVECESYSADLPLWTELAEARPGPVLDLGCGTGRVAMHLAGRDHPVRGIDADAGLVEAFNARRGSLPATAVRADARDFSLGAEFNLMVAPMQLLQLFSGPGDRAACLRCVAGHLAPGGLAAFAIVESMPSPADALPPLPDTREVDGWVYSSLPIETAIDGGRIRVRRLRQTVSPAGELSEELDEVVLHALDAATLEGEARPAGLHPAGRRTIAPTEDHVGSTVVLLEREA